MFLPVRTIPRMIVSPCEKICVLDPAAGLCAGCGRSLAEIERWASLTDAERAQIMAELPARVEALRGGARQTSEI